MRRQLYSALLFIVLAAIGCSAEHNQIIFQDDFESGLSKWKLINTVRIQTLDSQNPAHNQVLVLNAGAPVHALITGSEGWSNISIEGDVLFPEDEHNYLGVIYNYNVKKPRVDYGCIYIKGNGSYLRVNPHRDNLVSRTIYEEYKTDLTGPDAITIGKWQHFKAEIAGPVCHFYVGDMETPKVTYNFHEYTSGMVGFEPRVYGSEVWLDNIKVRKLPRLSYQGSILPEGISYEPEQFIQQWQALGPIRNRLASIEMSPTAFAAKENATQQQKNWMPFSTDPRGCVVTGRLFEFESTRWLLYLSTEFEAPQDGSARLQFSTTDKLIVWLNGVPLGEIEPTYNAWYDFYKNPEHSGSELTLPVQPGKNFLLILATSVGSKYSGDGFYARMAIVK